MARKGVYIVVQGLENMVRDFEQLTTPEPYERGREALNAALRVGFEGTQMAVPVGTGDYRRPAGALRDSGRSSSEFDGDTWAGSVTYGTHDDVMPYAVWARWKHLKNAGVDYMEPMDDATDDFERAMNAPFDDVFGPVHD
jgi:hypothetical protein